MGVRCAIKQANFSKCVAYYNQRMCLASGTHFCFQELGTLCDF